MSSDAQISEDKSPKEDMVTAFIHSLHSGRCHVECKSINRFKYLQVTNFHLLHPSADSKPTPTTPLPTRLLRSGRLKTCWITDWLPRPVQLTTVPGGGVNLSISRAPHLSSHPYLSLLINLQISCSSASQIHPNPFQIFLTTFTSRLQNL